MARSCCGSWFQTCGPAKENARSPNLVDSLGYFWNDSGETWSDSVAGEKCLGVMGPMGRRSAKGKTV